MKFGWNVGKGMIFLFFSPLRPIDQKNGSVAELNMQMFGIELPESLQIQISIKQSRNNNPYLCDFVSV